MIHETIQHFISTQEIENAEQFTKKYAIKISECTSTEEIFSYLPLLTCVDAEIKIFQSRTKLLIERLDSAAIFESKEEANLIKAILEYHLHKETYPIIDVNQDCICNELGLALYEQYMGLHFLRKAFGKIFQNVESCTEYSFLLVQAGKIHDQADKDAAMLYLDAAIRYFNRFQSMVGEDVLLLAQATNALMQAKYLKERIYGIEKLDQEASVKALNSAAKLCQQYLDAGPNSFSEQMCFETACQGIALSVLIHEKITEELLVEIDYLLTFLN